MMSGSWDNDFEGDWAHDEPAPAAQKGPSGQPPAARPTPAARTAQTNKPSDAGSGGYIVPMAVVLGLVALGYYTASRREES